MKRSILAFLLLSLILGCLAGCSQKSTEVPVTSEVIEVTPEPTPEPTSEPTPEPTPEPEVTPEPTPEPEPEGFHNPLTGETVEEDMSTLRPYLVMINNIRVAQPQEGISKADIIYELMEEGGITRMMAFFLDMEDVDCVGSIRSARKYNVSVALAYDGILVHAGGSDEALNYIDAMGVDDLCSVRGRYTGNAFYRDSGRQSYGIEHSLFGNGELLVQSAANRGYWADHSEGYDGTYGLTFSETAADQCIGDANRIYITYDAGKTMNFYYDAEKGTYTGEQFGSTYADDYTIPVEFKNVLVINADTHLQSDGLHLTIDLLGEGSGYFCCGGRYVPIRWYRDGESDNFHYTLEDGTPLALGIGKTFVAVQQVGGYHGTTEFSA